jgi:VanZ family protein
MRQNLRIGLPLVYMALLFAMSSLPGTGLETTPGLGEITPKWQNLLHIPVFGGLSLAWLWALQRRLPVARQRAYAAFALTLLYAAVDESWQNTIPGRFGSLNDFGLDALGAGLALWCLGPCLSRRTM